MTVPLPFETGREYLDAALAWLDAALLTLARGMAPVPSDGQGTFVSVGEVERILSTGDRRPAPDAAPDALNALRDDLRRRRAASAAAGVVLPIDRLTAAFGLGDAEESLIIACLAEHVDAGYAKVFAYLHDDLSRDRCSRDLIRRLAALDPTGSGPTGPAGRYAPVFRWGLVTPLPGRSGLGEELALDPDVADLLLDRAAGGAGPPGHPADGSGTDVDVAAALHPAVVDRLTVLMKEHRGLVVRFDGPASADGAAVFAAACRALGVGRRHVRLDPALSPPDRIARLRGAYRWALLAGEVVYVEGPDGTGGDTHQDPRAAEAIREWQDVVADGTWCSALRGEAGTVDRAGVIQLPVRLDLPGPAQRGLGWRSVLPELSDDDVAALAAGPAMPAAEVAAVARLAQVLAVDGRPSCNDLATARRTRSRTAAGGGTRTTVPRAGWDDLVLPTGVTQYLREFGAQIRHRARVGEEWGLWRRGGYGRGLAALFLGSSGTGKTLAAEVVAGSAGMDLLTVDLSAVVSKYIGETEKNLGRVFDEACRRGAVLFFDEADALFGRRSEVRDAHDRFANIEVGYLLQRIEEFDGVAVLASNLPRNIDDAFLRRMRVTVEFPFPDEAARLRIWQAHLPPTLPVHPDLDPAVLARDYKVTGGVISKIVWNAACLAADAGAPLGMAHVRHAARRDYQRPATSASRMGDR
ncbi:MAG: ATP-binding protein [Actinomycetota bacterium]|nr:ATP-binding protein [Actinomycetota bacterium]